MLHVHRLGQAVGVEQQCRLGGQLDFLLNINEVPKESDRQVGIHGQRLHVLVNQQGSIMTCIAIAQTSSGQVKHTDEHRDEHVGLVSLARSLVNRLNHSLGTALVQSQRAEERMDNGHYQ